MACNKTHMKVNNYTQDTVTCLNMAYDTTAIKYEGHVENMYTWSPVSSNVLE
jgi:hypothetical protein